MTNYTDLLMGAAILCLVLIAAGLIVWFFPRHEKKTMDPKDDKDYKDKIIKW